ncbi:hypothetical protein acsn021_07150 [Anaerocolumna cellulosilytica]|uniref:Uncharacterized protein n=1 Tax=Anaerocolumna cellulosilytica TaxID=433286 RepID=A0A6S6QTZ2_9FIRM|nr:hypothetical protein [Anaerocolumna cellulosilytica]MBB5198024.1 hypothetical protein [Anaerocolumna cellulosilytica]BCJ93146.1 hypothetical protein acsn021_07150 [Anaerocolumna cellulosilytica]
MATTNANDGRPRDNRSNNRLNENYRPGTSRDNCRNKTGQENKNSKPIHRGDKPYQKEFKENKPYKSENRSYGGSRSGTVKDGRDYTPYGNYKKEARNSGYYKNKDSDEDYGKGYGGGKDKRNSDSRGKASQNKEKEQQPEKFEIIKRLEREKKAITRKNQELDKQAEKQGKAQTRHRKTNRIDWTKGYEKGLYGDDDEDYTEYI